LFLVSVAFQGFLFEVHVGGLLPFHYLFSAFVLSFSWLLARRGAHMDIRLVQLGLDLEKSNSALAAHNQNLEAEVKERTEELMEAEKRTYSMMLDQRQRDLEALNANNQMKMQLRRQLVLDLQEILKAGPEQQAQLRSLIAGLQGQIATEERLGVLQDDLETVNAEFYARLAARFPLLSKSEKELCALLKLNLSSKDIAAVRQGSINTVNVARHRLKKKLELGADEDLETFIQNF
jgi:DNA-binding CsgD family transcriptional regulator